ncbi:MAG: flagellar type III secretion system protein FliR [Beijerinckiaceae bacterium]|nr:MAG: flagellar type III secretion system protein FliR [Beijerinckiaceae bacterium]
MTNIGSDTVLSAFILFCRIGACLMLMPGFSSPRVPVVVRLFLTVAITLVFVPLLGADVVKLIDKATPFRLLHIIVTESLIGGMIGFMGRIFFAALETLGSAIAQEIGLSNSLGAPVEDDSESLPTVATFLTLLATTLLFVTDLHWEILRGIIASYHALPIAGGFPTQFGMVQIANVLDTSFLLALRIASPFIVFSLIVNLGIGLANRLTPQIHVYFMATPIVVFAGLLLFYFTFRQLAEMFMAGFASWLMNG